MSEKSLNILVSSTTVQLGLSVDLFRDRYEKVCLRKIFGSIATDICMQWLQSFARHAG